MVQAGLDYSKNWDIQPVSQPVNRVKKVKKIYKKTNPKRTLLFKIGLALFIYAVLLVYLCIKSATLGYQLVELENEINKLETANSRIEYEIAEKSSLDRIEKVAVTELGMHKSDSRILVAAMFPEGVQVQVNTDEKKDGNSQMHIGEKPLEKLYASLVRLAGSNF